jgi:hypothetical protein
MLKQITDAAVSVQLLMQSLMQFLHLLQLLVTTDAEPVL